MTDYSTRLSAMAIYNGLEATEGPRMVRAAVPVDVTGNAVVDLSPQSSQLAFVQAVYVYNDTTAKITVTHRQTGFRFSVSPKTQGWFAVMATDNLAFDILSTVTGIVVPMIFTNVDMGMSVTTIA